MPQERSLLPDGLSASLRSVSSKGGYGPEPLNICPHCGSPYVQPVSCEQHGCGYLRLELRCPECYAWMSGSFSSEQIKQLESAITEGRSEVERLYHMRVKQNMRRAADCLGEALKRDLVSADDFKIRPQTSRLWLNKGEA